MVWQVMELVGIPLHQVNASASSFRIISNSRGLMCVAILISGTIVQMEAKVQGSVFISLSSDSYVC